MAIRWTVLRVGVLLALGAVAGCKGDRTAAGGDNPTPPLGKQDGPDFADTECLVTLRSTAVSEDGTKLIGLVDYDAAELESGSKPGVSFTTKIGSLDGGDFQQICREGDRPDAGTCIGGVSLRPAGAGDGSLEGFVRLRFELPLNGAEAIELIPWMDQSNGGGERGRAWDHNRPEFDGDNSFRPNTRPGPFNDNYLAVGPNFSVPLDEDTCPKGGGCKLPGVKVARAYENVPLRDPTQLKWEPNATRPRVFVSEKLGSIVAFDDDEREAFSNDPFVRKPCGKGGLAPNEACVFLDWNDETYKRGGRFGENAPGWEEGFLDFEFHPDWPKEPFVYITYNSGLGDPEDEGARGKALWHLTRLESTDGGKTLDPSTAFELITLEKKGLTHNAGTLFFHPDDDDNLYVAVGTDGGFPFDKYDHSQNPSDLFGSVLRMDVIENDGEDWTELEREQGFRAPRDNPFANGTTPGRGGCPTGDFRGDPTCLRAANPLVWVYGTRNPWGMTLDRPTGRIYGAEIGENQREELNVYEAGKNYGYPIREGEVCTRRGRCDAEADGDLVEPLFVTYASDQARPADGIAGDSITGGFVYRGQGMPDLVGKYVFGDFISGGLYFWDPEVGGQPKLLENTGKSIARFGQNPNGELYFLDHQHKEFAVEAAPQQRADGGIYRIDAGACKAGAPPPENTYAFLSADGVGTEDSAAAYYRTNLEEIARRKDDGLARTLETYTLAQWKRDMGFDEQETRNIVYKNEWDLAFFRDMTCTAELGRGRGGCAVTNWQNASPVDGALQPKKDEFHLGTVTMNVSQDGFVQFWVFGDGDNKDDEEDDLIQGFAVLDDEDGDGPDLDKDKKYVPNVCTPCHGGGKYRINGSTDVGAVFREFEPSLMLVAEANDPVATNIEEAFRFFNNAALTANESLNTETPMIDFIDGELYPDGPLAGGAVSAFSPATIPDSWKTDEAGKTKGEADANEELIAAKADLWTDLVNPYCMTCHRIRKIEVDFSEYERWVGLGKNENGAGGAMPGLYTYITGSYRPGETEGHPIFMPQTQHLYDRLNGGGDNLQLGSLSPEDPLGVKAELAARKWIEVINDEGPQCEVVFEVQTDQVTQFGEDVFITGEVGNVDTGELGAWQPWDGVKLLGLDEGRRWSNAEPNADNEVDGPVKLPQGLDIQFQAVIVDSRKQSVEACNNRPRVRWQQPAFTNEAATIKTGDGCTQVIKLDLRGRGFGEAFCD